MAAYATAQQIADYLGQTLTAAWSGQAMTHAQAASDWIDRYLGRSWQGSSPLTETQKLYGDRFWTTRPITSVTSIKTRGAWPAATESAALTADVDYRVLDAAAGEIAISGYDGYRVTVVYTSSGTVPTPVALAAVMLAAWWTHLAIHPDAAGVKQIAVGNGDLSISYADPGGTSYPGGVPAEVWTLLGLYRRVLVA